MTHLLNVNLMGQRRRKKDIGIGGSAARWYDNNTRRHRLAEMEGYAREVSRHLKDDPSTSSSPFVLEVAPGPGYLSIALAKLGRYRILGLDISKDFVEIARRNALKAGVEVEFREGNAADIPLPDETCDFIICTAAFKNFKNPSRALSEMYRVLRSGGTVMIADMNRDASNQQIDSYIRNMGAKGLDGLFMKLMFRYFLRKGAYAKDDFAKLVSDTEFGSYCDIKEEGIGLHVYLRKQ